MAKISRDEIKKHGFKRFLRSFSYSLDGLKYAYKYEQSMFIHFICTIAVILTNILLHITRVEWYVTLISIGMVLSAELVNTAIEAVVDLVTLEIHPLAKIAKDCGSAATFVLALMAATVAAFVYIPHIVEILGL